MQASRQACKLPSVSTAQQTLKPCLHFLKASNSLLASLSDPCQYTLEMENSRNQFQVIYTGTSVSHKISKLVENKVYRFRMCASNTAGYGPYSQVYEFRTSYAHPHPIKGKSNY